MCNNNNNNINKSPILTAVFSLTLNKFDYFNHNKVYYFFHYYIYYLLSLNR